MYSVYKMNSFERALPYLIVFPFGYFVYSELYKNVRSRVIQDSKSGKIKDTFVNRWLKETGTNRVILKDEDLRKQSVWFLEELVKQQQTQDTALELVTKVVNKPLAGQQARDVAFEIVKNLALGDEENHSVFFNFSEVFLQRDLHQDFLELFSESQLYQELGNLFL
mmetsp:Transcript_6394/g.9502  ORF Transcript_6394/g.9502 Transcript_6394/m.9502 type:complete len:166 (+) Transcript_6394:22-519(+)